MIDNNGFETPLTTMSVILVVCLIDHPSFWRVSRMYRYPIPFAISFQAVGNFRRRNRGVTLGLVDIMKRNDAEWMQQEMPAHKSNPRSVMLRPSGLKI